MEDSKFWSDVSQKIMKEVHQAITPLVGEKEAGEIVKMGADGTPTKLIDLVAEEKVVDVLEGVERPLILVSEEIGRINIGSGSPEVIFVVDPLDGTSNAVKNIPAYGISLAIAKINDMDRSMTIQDIEMGFVKNFATGDIYQAIKGGGASLNGQDISTSTLTDISRSSIGAYIYRADMEKVDKICKMIRRMRIMGSVAIELCYVADGTYDAFMDIRGNLRIVDIAAAKLIIEEAAGIVTDEYGQPLNGKLNVLDRTSIIASGNSKFHQEMIRLIGGI
ncbi:MAG TPA: bifunctional fructose-bisphosphatase/inositol-phosphate phosphatase [Methanobacterium sp.]|jgi:myo-inositol-1(or 4)-monophosphatase|nr:MAG: bifunctional fructose-bisphosphatase/inositol-phosphate phosphatase [Methanobacterium sp.]HOI72291.1 bifunctional fructose-bisphosphatase/inositol-phosphate phosphatase [Methanobacterium sp.]